MRIGVIGTALVALCCFTPVLIILLGVVGLSALTGYLDYVLLPALATFVGLTAYAAVRIAGTRRGGAPHDAGDDK